jgi:hypothetical protein
MTTELAQKATEWIDQKQSVIPIRFRDKRPEVKAWQPYTERLPTQDEVRLWFPDRLHNLAVLTGIRGLTVIDFDNMERYLFWVLYAKKQGGYAELVSKITLRVRTGRGVHVYIRLPYEEQNRHLEGIDIKGRGGYVLTPPSVHPSGAQYVEENPGAPIMEVEALSDILPAELLIRDYTLPKCVVMPVNFVDPVHFISDPWEVAEKATEFGSNTIARIRARYRIEEFFSEKTSTSVDNRFFLVKCPFHDDHNPSFWVDTAKQMCGCFTGCTPKSLDVINLYGRLHGLSNKESIRMMLKGM